MCLRLRISFFLIFGLVYLGLGISGQVLAQTQAAEYSRASVTEVVREQELPGEHPEQHFYVQLLKVKRADTGQESQVQVGTEFQPLTAAQRLSPQREVVVVEQIGPAGEPELVVSDVYRLGVIAILGAVFVVVVLLVARWQGLYALLGMGISLGVIIHGLVPALLAGHDPVLISLVASLVIGAATLYLTHGFNLKSHLALVSIVITLGVVGVAASLAVQAAHLVGLGSEEAYFLQFGDTALINLQGLLLGGIMLGALGILDDITVSQISVVYQLKAVKKELTWQELYQRSLVVGKDHVASLVNTLVLAYAGANLPLFLLFSVNRNVPIWVTLNSEIIVEEVVRTLAGSLGLVVAVPLSSLLASIVITRYPQFVQEKETEHEHRH